ncbi:SprB repeat-containing protein, partial [Flavobacterium sp.]|uniref:SprB repeat-containing protein n=1 Tax=Flavobacterium sp. TaxID=239 RepID=UPI00262AE8C5
MSIFTSHAQLATPFTPRLTTGSIKVKGDVLLIGNSIIKGKGLANPYNGAANNNNEEGEYIDVDSDPTTFSSSTAKLEINNSCKRIVFAGLYWASIYPNEVSTNSSQFFTGTQRLNDWNQVKFKLPNGTNLNLTANKTNPKEVIFDGYNYTNINNSFKDSPIICFKDITADIAALTNADGEYTLANLRATRGRRNGGCAAGWTLVVIYESPTLPSKFISVFDGYAGVQGNDQLNIPISGFKTLPSPFPVNAKIGVSALEGDLGITGDTFQFKAASKATFTNISDAVSAANNFFNSTNSNNGVKITSGNPASTNLLGYDIKNVKIPNALNAVIPNNETAGDLKLTTSGDGYGAFVTTFAVDIIEPKILLTKEVKDEAGNDASGANVTPSQQLYYVLGFENQGNDDAAQFTIKDKLPINVGFNYPADIDPSSLPPGVTHSYVAPSAANGFRGEITFNIPNNLVKANLTPGPPFVRYEIKLKVKVSRCNELSDACANIIQNTAYARYRGVTNTTFYDEESYASYTSCNLGTPQPTNFLVGVNDCLFTQNAILCGSSTVLTASDGYRTYTWTGPFGFTATGQTVTVTNPGVYKIFGEGNRPCIDYREEITVAPFGGTTTNPITPYADNAPDKNNLPVCPDNGKFLPKIFLCGLNDFRQIATGITGATSIVWEKTTCLPPSNLSTLCANESSSCSWTSAGPNGPNFTANSEGQFRLTINYSGGCFNRYYFNVYKNTLNPTATKTDIYCNTPGSITVGNVPSGYEYSLNNTTYQASNVFSVTTAGLYNVYVRQTGVSTNPCIFQVKDIQISASNFSTTVNATQPRCYGDKATILVAANNVRPQYKFDLYLQGSATIVNTSGLITASNQYTFVNVNPGKYSIVTTTDDGCTNTRSIEIIEPSQLKGTAAVTKSLTCTDGEITVTATGGTAPYNYSVNGAAFVTDPVIPVTNPGGNFSIQVVDANNCSITLPTLTLNSIPKPVYTVTKTDIKCYNDKGAIQFNVSNANGYTLQYSIDNGVTFSNNPIFSNLSSGTYQAVLKYSITESNGTVTSCLDPEQTIIIGSPAAALTASAGVSALAGCTLSNQGGTIRFTNVSGGTPIYTYSFDGGSTFQAASSKDVLPGTYTLVVKDSQGCTFTIPYPVILDPIPTAPTISVSTANFNCDGTGTSTVTVTNSGSANYNYEYLIDGVKNTNTADPKVFLNVPSGNHTISVNYILTSASTFSNLLEENFGIGPNTTTPGIAAAYCYHNLDVVPSTCPNKALTLEDNQYVVTRGIVPNNSAWFAFRDHTSAATTPNPNGRFLAINIGGAAGANGILYSQIINDVIPNQPVIVEAYLANLFRANFVGGADPSFSFELVDLAGNVIAQQPPIPPNPNPTGVPPIPPILRSNKWELRTVSLNPGNNTSLRFNVRSGSTVYNGNDAAIDDIKVYQLPATCITKKDFPIVVPTDKKFTVAITGHTNLTCFNANDGTITIAAQNFNATYGFDYSLNNGSTWVNTKTSPVTVSLLSAQTYAIKVRYDNTAGTCSFDFSQPITAPTAVTVTASVTTQPTCTTGATITAVAAGGTAGYFYELRRTDNTVVVAFKNSGVFTNVATGSYIVIARDANQCLSQASASVTVTAPIAPVASLSSTSDLCYDTVNKATLVVSVTGGTGALSYSLDGASGQSSSTFNNVNPGTHTIVVTDSNNCTATISNIVIAPELVATPTVSKTLDCSTSNPNGTIDVAITGGTAAFTYTVKKDAGAYGSSVNVTGSSFTYIATTSGLYTFLITDATGCTVTTMATINAISNPTVTATPTQISCFGFSNGSVLLSGAGGAGGYTYSFNGSAFTTSATYLGLSAGIAYPYQVKDSKECVASGTITLTQPTQLVVSATATPFSCSATNAKQSATVTITVPTTGTAPYTYSFDNGSTFVAGNTKNYTDNGSDQVINYQV